MSEFMPFEEVLILDCHRRTFVALGVLEPALTPQEVKTKLNDVDFAVKLNNKVTDLKQQLAGRGVAA